jgi:2-dehydropantoate 2-reductase
MGEVVAGAKACGVVLPENIIHKMLTSTDAMDAYEPSMKLDFDAGRPLEIASIYGRPCSAIQQAGGTAANIEALFAQLSCLETI